MSTVWFVTRSYPPMRGGGPFTRQMQVFALRRHFRVVVVTREDKSLRPDDEPDVVRLPQDSFPYRAALMLEKLGVRGDQMRQWAMSAVSYLLERVNPGDVVFTTSGGEITCLEIGARVVSARQTAVHITNYHDLLDYGVYDGVRVYDDFHVPIDNRERIALSTVSWFFANSDVMREIMVRKFPFLESKSSTLYFGYPDGQSDKGTPRRIGGKITIGYAGTMGVFQRPEVILDAWRSLSPAHRSRLRLLFVGDYSSNGAIDAASDSGILRFPYMPRNDMIALFASEVDLAFLSAINKHTLRPLMPTKFYEYIGLEMPVLAAVPVDCEAAHVIAKNGYGFVSVHGDTDALCGNLEEIAESPERVAVFRDNLRRTKWQFAAAHTLTAMIPVVRGFLSKPGSAHLNAKGPALPVSEVEGQSLNAAMSSEDDR